MLLILIHHLVIIFFFLILNKNIEVAKSSRKRKNGPTLEDQSIGNKEFVEKFLTNCWKNLNNYVPKKMKCWEEMVCEPKKKDFYQ